MKKKKINEKDIVKLRRKTKFGELLSGIIHNLNTPLMGISGRLELIKFKNPDMKGIDQMSEQLDKINNLLSVTANILEADRSYDLKNVKLSEVVNNMNSLLKANMKYKHKIDVKLELDDDLAVNIMPGYLYNSLYEILDNCIDAVDDDGSIVIKVYKDENNTAVLEVLNDSENVPTELIEKVGQPLLSDKEENLGMGLYLIRYYVKRLSGTFEFGNYEDGVFYKIKIPLK